VVHSWRLVRYTNSECRLKLGTDIAIHQIGPKVRVSARKVWISMASSYPYQALFETLYQRLRI
jgi:hypothetical protein